MGKAKSTWSNSYLTTCFLQMKIMAVNMHVPLDEMKQICKEAMRRCWVDRSFVEPGVAHFAVQEESQCAALREALVELGIPTKRVDVFETSYFSEYLDTLRRGPGCVLITLERDDCNRTGVSDDCIATKVTQTSFFFRETCI